MTATLKRDSEHAAGAWEDVESWVTPDDPNFALDPNGTWYEEAVEAEVMNESPVPVPKKRVYKRSRVSVCPLPPNYLGDHDFDILFFSLKKRPHAIWKENYRQAYLDEMARFAGRADFQAASECPDCLARKVKAPGAAEYRCEECLIPDLCCGPCCVRRHRTQPFHRVKVWPLCFPKPSFFSFPTLC